MAGGGGKLGKGAEVLGAASKYLEQEGAERRVSGNFFKAVVQQVLLFGADTWVMIPRIERALESFMHGAERRITGRQPQRGWYVKWYYPSLREAMQEAGFTDIHVSITRRQNMVA